MTHSLAPYSHYLIIDLEATCCDQNTVPRKAMETIEIGAVMVEASSLQIVAEFNTFIKPMRHPILTLFCTTLTTIKQTDVDSAPTYPEAIQTLQHWLQPYENIVFCSWGDYDYHQLKQDSEYHQLPFPIAAPHVNIKKLFSTTQQLPKAYGMNYALRLAGLTLQGTHHRGIDDARNMARLLPWIVGQQTL